MLGSFSNFVVSKSSVPTFVARKRLRKPGKIDRPSIKLANNLSSGAFTSAFGKTRE
jgi:hypothetical protein